MGNKHGTLSLGRCRDKHRADERSKNWSFHSMDGKRVGSTPRSHVSSSVSIHTGAGYSFVKYHARGGSTIRSAGTKIALDVEDEIDGCGRAGLVVRSLSAPAHDVRSVETVPDTGKSSCASGLSMTLACLAEHNYTINQIPSTPTNDALPVELERLQQQLEGSSAASEDPWVRRESRLETSENSTKSEIRKEPPCRRKLFGDTTRDSCSGGVADSANLDSLAKHKIKTTFSKITLKGSRKDKDLSNHKQSTDKAIEEASPHRLKALSYLSKMWQERLKSSSNRLHSKSHQNNKSASHSGLAGIKSAKESQLTHSLSSGKLDNTSAIESQACHLSGERERFFLTNQKCHKGMLASVKILNKKSEKHARLYKSSDTIINKSTDASATTNETNEYFERRVNREFLPSSTSEHLISTSERAVSLLAKNKHRNVSTSSADSSDNLSSKPPKNPFHRGFLPTETSTSLGNLHSEPAKARRTLRQLEEHSSVGNNQSRHEQERTTSYRSRRSLQCFSLNLDTFTEEFLDVNPASLLDLAIDQITNATPSTKDTSIDIHSGKTNNQSNQALNSTPFTQTDTSDTLCIPSCNNSIQGQKMTEIGKLNSTRCKLNLPVGRNRPEKRCDKKPFYFANSRNVDSSHSFAMSSLTTTPTTTDSGYNTESSFSCEKTPKITKVFDSPISEILYYNVVDEEDFEEPFSLTRCSSDKIANKEEHGRFMGVKYGGVLDNLKTTEGQERNRDRAMNESGKKTSELYLEEICIKKGELLVKTGIGDSNGSTHFNEKHRRDFSRQINDWHLEFAKTCQINYNEAVTDTIEQMVRCGVNCDDFEVKDGCHVNVCLGKCEIEEIKNQTNEDRNVQVSQSRDTHVCDDKNMIAHTNGNEHFNVTRILLSGETSCTTLVGPKLKTPEAINCTQEITDFAKTERHSVKQEDTLQAVTNYREEDIRSTRQEEQDYTIQVKKSSSAQEKTERIPCDFISREVCCNDEDSVSKHNTSTADMLPTWKVNQQNKPCEKNSKGRGNRHYTDLSAAQSLLRTTRSFVKCNTRCNCTGISSNTAALVNNDDPRQDFDECISSLSEISVVNTQNTKEGHTRSSSEDIFMDHENDSQISSLNCAHIPITDASDLVDDVTDLSDNGCKIILSTSQDYSTNGGENSPQNGTKRDSQSIFRLADSEGMGGNVVTEEQDQSTTDNGTHVCYASRGGNCCACSGDGVGGNICRQTSRDTDQLKGLSGFFSCCLGNGDNSNEFSTVACDELISQSAPLLSDQLQNNLKSRGYKKDLDITTTKLTTPTEELTFLDSTPNNHQNYQSDAKSLEFINDNSNHMVICDDGNISTNSSSCEFAKIVNSENEEWRCSTPCFIGQSSRLCLENLVRCFEGISDVYSQEGQQLGGIWSQTYSTSGALTTDFTSSDAFIEKLHKSDNYARFLKELNQPEYFETVLERTVQSSIPDSCGDKLNQFNISGSFSDIGDQSVSSCKVVENLREPVTHEQFTERLLQGNNCNTCIEQLSNSQSHGIRVDNQAQASIAVDKSSQPTCSDTFIEPSRKRQERLLKTLSVSDSNLPNLLFNEALKSTFDKKPSIPRRKRNLGFAAVHKENDDLLHPLSEVNPFTVYNANNNASDYNLYFSDNANNIGLYTCGSAEMLNSCYYNNIKNGDYNVDGSYGKKVVSCTNLTEHRSRYRSKIAMGMASARMRSNASPVRNACMNLSLRMAHSASPISDNIPPENSSTSKSSEVYRNPRQGCVLGTSQNRKTALNREELKQDNSTLNTFVKHSRSLDMYINREGSSVYMYEQAKDPRVSKSGDQKAGRYNISREKHSSDKTQRYLSETNDISNSCVGGDKLDQLPFKSASNDFCESSLKTATINMANVYTSSSCVNQPNLDSENPYKNTQTACTKDAIKSGLFSSHHTAPNKTISPYNPKYTMDASMLGRHFPQLGNCFINSLDTALVHDFSNQSLPIIDAHSNNLTAEADNVVASEYCGATNIQYPRVRLQNDPVNMDSNSTETSRLETSPLLVQSSSLQRKNRDDRIWNYSMTSLLEGSTSAELLCEEAVPVMDPASVEVCPTCHRPFDGGKKRRLIDSCGHERCFSCMFNSEVCSVCVAQARTRTNPSKPTLPPSGYQPRATLNRFLTDQTSCTQHPPEIPPRVRRPTSSTGVQGPPPPLPAKAKHFHHQGSSPRSKHSPAHYSNQSLVGSKQSPVTMDTFNLDRESESPPPPPPDVAQHDLMMRLGLLLGDPIHPSGITGVGIVLPGNQQGETTLNSISSLSSNEHTPEKCVLDVSPMLNLTASMPGVQDDIPLFGSKRNASVCRSARISVNGRRSEPRTTKSDELQMKPLVFEVPHPEGKPIFVGRAWLFNKLEAVFGVDGCGALKSNGVIITGSQGTGKTAIVEQLLNHSCFSDDSSGYTSSRSQDKHQSNNNPGTKLTDYTALNGLGFQVVAYHICQADNSATCMVADMVSSMAAQMAKAPQLVAYRELLLQEPYLQSILSITECTQNPSLSFIKGILEPLQMLKNAGKIFTDCCIIMVDSLNEAEFHKPDHGDTIASFLCSHGSKFPDWLKLVVTVQSSFQGITSSLQFSRISLDQLGNNSDHVSKDIVSYIDHRISISSTIRANISINGRPNKELTSKFTSHVQNLSNGSFLYAKLVIDLIENGHLIPKSSSYAILPVNLSEVFLLHFNLKFSSVRAFERVSSILAVCLASLYPLKLVEIFLTVNSGYVHQYLSWEDFSQRMDMLAGFIYSCHDNTVKFFHPAFREWLIHRNEGDSPKFLCDLRHGHALMAFRLSRVSAPLTPEKTIEFGHHILKAHIYKSVSRQLGYSSQNVQAYWMCLSSHSLNAALVSHRNVYSPNVKVSRLILLSGGNPNSRTEYLGNAPILCVAAREGYIDMLSLLLEFGADPNMTSETGMSPLCHGASGGHVEVMRMLCLHNALPSAQDVQGHSAAIHAVINGQLEAVKFLMHLNWTVLPHEPTKDEVITQCFVASAATGNTQILEYLHQTYNGSRLNMVDSLLCETALTAACLNGRSPCVKFLLDSKADVTVTNARFFTPLLCAVKCGHGEICELLLARGADLEMTDQNGCTPLMMAAREGHKTVLTFLLDKGANQMTTDRQGLTALCWGCLQGHLSVVESLVTHGSNVHHSDVNGRSPLHLAAMYGDVSVVQFLIDHKAQIELTDINGMRALDCAIFYNNIAVIICFLRKGAKLGPNTWALAADKMDVLLLLLNKLTEDGSILYKKNRIKEASQRYQYALKKLPMKVRPEEVQTFQELKLSFLLNLSRCKRRMNDLQSAIDLATKALEVRPKCFEAYYARARARRDSRQYAAAQQDLVEALNLAPKNRELQRLLTRVKEECWEQMARYESGAGREAVNLEMDRIVEEMTMIP